MLLLLFWQPWFRCTGKPWDSMTFIFMGAVCVSFAVILFWLVYIVCLYIVIQNIF